MKRLIATSSVVLFCGWVGCQSKGGTSAVDVGDAATGSMNESTPDAGSMNVAPSTGGTTSSMADGAPPPSASTVTAEGVCCDVSTPAGCSDVRDCVCVDWQQQDCCTEWTTFCQVTAEEKCGAAPGCTGLPTGSAETTADSGAEKGACCTAHDSTGCADPAIEQCVCGLLPDCCTVKWDALCVQLVNEKHCEAGVRTCVCDQWQQSTCCTTEWTSFCQTVAEEKCMAQPGCG